MRALARRVAPYVVPWGMMFPAAVVIYTTHHPFALSIAILWLLIDFWLTSQILPGEFEDLER